MPDDLDAEPGDGPRCQCCGLEVWEHAGPGHATLCESCVSTMAGRGAEFSAACGHFARVVWAELRKVFRRSDRD